MNRNKLTPLEVKRARRVHHHLEPRRALHHLVEGALDGNVAHHGDAQPLALVGVRVAQPRGLVLGAHRRHHRVARREELVHEVRCCCCSASALATARRGKGRPLGEGVWLSGEQGGGRGGNGHTGDEARATCRRRASSKSALAHLSFPFLSSQRVREPVDATYPSQESWSSLLQNKNPMGHKTRPQGQLLKLSPQRNVLQQGQQSEARRRES